MLFALTNPTETKLVSFTARTEHHGEELVSALTLGLSITGPNDLLDRLSPTLRHALYTVADDWTPGLEGVEPPTPKLRTKQLVTPLALAVPEIKGGRLFVQWGVGEDMSFEVTSLGKWRVDVFDGGTVTLGFRVSSNDVDETEAGHLFGKQGQTIHIRFEPPAAAPGPSDGETIDGSSGHPGAGPLFDEDDGEPEQDATQEFLEQHGEPERGEDWPFPQTDAGGTDFHNSVPDDGSDEAEAPAAPAKRKRGRAGAAA